MIIIVNLVGCLKTTKAEEKVKQDEIDDYWEDLTKRDAEAAKDTSLESQQYVCYILFFEDDGTVVYSPYDSAYIYISHPYISQVILPVQK